MTTIITAIGSKIEGIEIHPDRSKWSEALSDRQGPTVGFWDIADGINKPL